MKCKLVHNFIVSEQYLFCSIAVISGRTTRFAVVIHVSKALEFHLLEGAEQEKWWLWY